MQTTEGLRTVRPDAKGRIALGSLAEGISSFKVRKDSQNRIILEPFVEIPANEKWLYENKAAHTMVKKGLEDARAGRVVKKGSFAKYITENDE